jgi:hypothetical protein
LGTQLAASSPGDALEFDDRPDVPVDARQHRLDMCFRDRPYRPRFLRFRPAFFQTADGYRPSKRNLR